MNKQYSITLSAEQAGIDADRSFSDSILRGEGWSGASGWGGALGGNAYE
jgi:hypothetical protein